MNRGGKKKKDWALQSEDGFVTTQSRLGEVEWGGAEWAMARMDAEQ
jgi:hypothetical protein